MSQYEPNALERRYRNFSNAEILRRREGARKAVWRSLGLIAASACRFNWAEVADYAMSLRVAACNAQVADAEYEFRHLAKWEKAL